MGIAQQKETTVLRKKLSRVSFLNLSSCAFPLFFFCSPHLFLRPFFSFFSSLFSFSPIYFLFSLSFSFYSLFRLFFQIIHVHLKLKFENEGWNVSSFHKHLYGKMKFDLSLTQVDVGWVLLLNSVWFFLTASYICQFCAQNVLLRNIFVFSCLFCTVEYFQSLCSCSTITNLIIPVYLYKIA